MYVAMTPGGSSLVSPTSLLVGHRSFPAFCTEFDALLVLRRVGAGLNVQGFDTDGANSRAGLEVEVSDLGTTGSD